MVDGIDAGTMAARKLFEYPLPAVFTVQPVIFPAEMVAEMLPPVPPPKVTVVLGVLLKPSPALRTVQPEIAPEVALTCNCAPYPAYVVRATLLDNDT